MKIHLPSIYSKYDGSLVLRLLYILILSGPPALSIALKESSVLNFITANFGFLLFLNPTRPGIIILLALWVPVLTGITHYLGYLAKQDYYYLNQKGYAALMAAIEEIVAKKTDRLGKALFKKEKNKMEMHFNPVEQMQTIVEQLYNFLKELNTTKNELAIRLWKIENGKPIDLIYNYPHSSSKVIQSSELFTVETEFKKVIKRKRASIIENSKLDRSFRRIDACKECIGCNVFSIPVFDDKNQIVYSVLQIRYKYSYTNVPTYRKKDIDVHLKVFEKFIRRLELEHIVYSLYKEKHYVK